MTWQAAIYYKAVCDRCSHELEHEDDGSTVLFAPNDARSIEEWRWLEVRKDAGSTELICSDCVEAIGSDDATIAKAAAEETRWDQTGPTLLDSTLPDPSPVCPAAGDGYCNNLHEGHACSRRPHTDGAHACICYQKWTNQ